MSSPPSCLPKWLTSPVRVCVSGMSPFLAIVRLDRLFCSGFQRNFPSPSNLMSSVTGAYSAADYSNGRPPLGSTSSDLSTARIPFTIVRDCQHFLPSFTGVSVLGNILRKSTLSGIQRRISLRPRTPLTIRVDFIIIFRPAEASTLSTVPPTLALPSRQR